MKIIFGLGNPGRQYKNNRHNIGYMVVDKLAGMQKVSFKRKVKLSALLAMKRIKGEEVFFVKPCTFMNNSGLCVEKIVDKYKVLIQNMLIIYDDVDLSLGQIRFRQKGSCAGHRGMASIISTLGSQQVNRLRVGVGRPQNGELPDYVLSDFSVSEREVLPDSIAQAASACLDWVNEGPDFVMKTYNRRNST